MFPNSKNHRNLILGSTGLFPKYILGVQESDIFYIRLIKVIDFGDLQLHPLNSLIRWKNPSASTHQALTVNICVLLWHKMAKDFENFMLILYALQNCHVFHNIAISFAFSAYNWYAEMKLSFFLLLFVLHININNFKCCVTCEDLNYNYYNLW